MKTIRLAQAGELTAQPLKGSSVQRSPRKPSCQVVKVTGRAEAGAIRGARETRRHNAVE